MVDSKKEGEDFESIPLDASDEKSATDAKPKKTDTEESASDSDGNNPSKKSSMFFSAAAKSGRELGVWESSLEDRSGMLSRWTLGYLTPLLRIGGGKVLDADDIGVPSAEDEAEKAFQTALTAWNHQTKIADEANEVLKKKYKGALANCSSDEEKEKVKEPKWHEPSIAKALMKGFGGWTLVVGLVYYILSAFLGFVPVIILNDLVRFFESGVPITEWDGLTHPWVEVAALGVAPFLISLLVTRHQTIFAHCAVFVRTAVSTLLYRKALRVSPAGRASTSTGQVVNLMSNDTAQLQRFLQFCGFTFVAPLQIIIALILIHRQVGHATWVGVGFMVVLAPVNMVVFSVVTKQRRKALKYSDLRVKMMNEILSGIRIIKFYAWERPFGKEVATLRAKEMKALTKLAYTSAIGFSLILLAAPLIQPILVFMTYVAIQDEPLDAATAFTTVALFNIMRFPFAFLPMGLLQYIQSKISLRRLERYLALPELDEYVEDSPPSGEDSDKFAEGSITIRNGTFSWVDPEADPIRPVQEPDKKKKPSRKERRASKKAEKDSEDGSAMNSSVHSTNSQASEGSNKPSFFLRDLDITIPPGSLTAVVGTVGSGKSSLLSALLGELAPINGSKVYIPRSADSGTGYTSFCAQSPWVVNDTLRGNILFGREYAQERYDAVVEACALLDDLNILPAGDLTEIGERGINLSGGQKARVSLARALYSEETRVMLMDDPLSAVDAHVGEHIFTNAISGPITTGLTRVLVTHHVHLLSRCDSVVVMEKGRIKHHGKYSDLVNQGVDFAGAIDVSKTTTSENTNEGQEGNEASATPTSTTGNDKNTTSPGKKGDKNSDALISKGKKLVTDEEREEGSVAGSAYSRYAKAGGLCVAFTVVVVQGIGKASEVGAGFWLAQWAKEAVSAAQAGTQLDDKETRFYFGIYAAFGLFGVLGLTLRSVVIAIHRLRASQLLHDQLTESVLRAPVAFFDVTPIGRILNRFAADMDKIDLELTQSLSQGVSTVFNVVGSIAGIIVATKGTFLIPLLPISVLYYLVQKWFRKTSTELQRLNSVANSPIFADFSQILSGTTTIRAYGEQSRFFRQCQDSFDNMNASYLLVQLANYWLGLRLDVLGGFMAAFIGGVAVATSSSGFIPAGWLGLALSYSIEVTNFLKHGVRMIATVEAQMNSVERVLYYTDEIEPEAPDFMEGKDPEPGMWPVGGEVDIQKASMRYREGPLVLRELSVNVKAGEKVGVCGRTGSGKSSLMVALFRIAELENDGGSISIDGVNIREIGTAALRLNISIIPQDPIIFSNTVRYNLDPFGNATDDDLWEVLKKVQMEEAITELPNGLAEVVAEGGDNFSQGQRQLLCIARALLRKPKVLVLDEATASIDNATDASIQTMIRENFSKATVLTIAHRLNTIMDSDRVLVLDDGEVAEYDTPEALLKQDGSLFRAMVEKSRDSKKNGDIFDE